MKDSDLAQVQQLLADGNFADALAGLDAQLADVSLDAANALFRGVALQQLGRAADAEAAYRKAIALGLKNVTLAWKNLAVMCYHAGRYADAADLVESYRDWRPDDAEAFELLVHSLVEQKKTDAAAKLVDEWRQRRPDDQAALALLQHVCQGERRWLDSLLAAGRAGTGAQAPDGTLVDNVFAALLAFGWYDVAARLLQSHPAARERRSSAVTWTRSSLAFESGDRNEAAREIEALLADPALTPRNLHSIALRALALGNFDLGWRLHRMRVQASGLVWDEHVPKWAGENLAGRNILVFSEQGAGDVIQFLRFVPLLAERDIRCTFVTYPDVVGLLAAAPGAARRENAEFSTAELDYQLQLMDLALVCGVRTPADIPAPARYLNAPPAAAAAWKERIDALPGMKVGLVWTGNPDYGNDHWRSASLRELAGLAALPGVSWVSLQKGDAGDEDVPQGFNLHRFADELTSYADTAALIEALDLVISVDTSVAHLAGALGKPVWIILPRRGKDWRWFLDEQRSPWYPSARLFTQEVAGRWDLLVSAQLRPALAAALLARPETPGDGSWQRQLLGLLQQAAPAVGSESLALAALGAGDCRALLPFARVLALSDDRPALLDAIRAHGGDAAALAWAEYAVRDPGTRGAALRLLRELQAAGCKLTLGAYCAYVFALGEAGEAELARCALRAAEERFPGHSALIFVAGQLAERSGRRAAAIRQTQAFVERNPRALAAHVRLYELHRAGNASAQAIAHLERAILLAPDDLSLLRLVAREALAANCTWLSAFLLDYLYRREASPRNVLAWASDLALRGERDAARELLASLPPELAGESDFALLFARLQLARALADGPQATALWQRLVDMRPGDKTLLLGYGWDLLSLGRIDEGWRHYASGLDAGHRSSLPFWDGVERAGSRLLVYQDQGQGDLLQFCVLLRRLPRSMRATLAVSRALKPFLRAQDLPCRVVGLDEVDWFADDYDWRIQLMALPAVVGADLLARPARYPHLRADAGLLPQWRARSAGDARLKVGIVWAGNPGYGNDAYRSTQLRDWLPLLEIEGLGFYNLQKDTASNQALALPQFDFCNIVADCASWQQTAAAVSLLDLVISIDSGVLHLAGGLGVEAWALLPASGTDFRWLREREDCPWYPSLTLVRQRAGESWGEVMQRVATLLVERKGLRWQRRQ